MRLRSMQTKRELHLELPFSHALRRTALPTRIPVAMRTLLDSIPTPPVKSATRNRHGIPASQSTRPTRRLISTGGWRKTATLASSPAHTSGRKRMRGQDCYQGNNMCQPPSLSSRRSGASGIFSRHFLCIDTRPAIGLFCIRRIEDAFHSRTEGHTRCMTLPRFMR